MDNPLFDALFRPHRGSETAFLHLPDGATLTHDAFLAVAARYAGALGAAGIAAGDRVAVQVEKSPQALAVYAACVQTGAVFLPLNTAYTPAEIDYFLRDAGAGLLICTGRARDALAPVAGTAGAGLQTLEADGTGSFADLAAATPETAEAAGRAPEDLAALLYTSGTTGRAKGAMLTQANLASNARTLAEVWAFTADDVLMHALPIFHSHGLFVACNVSLISGGAMIFLPRFELDTVLVWLGGATAMMGVPTFYTRLLDDARFDHAATAHMRLFTSGSAPLLGETHRRFEARTGHRIVERYGMTETNMNTSNPYAGPRKAGTVGPPLPGVEIAVTDPETGAELAQGETGAVEVRGPNVFRGYWGMPEKTAEELRTSGFFITGDLGRFDADGYLEIVGREKDLIIAGGYNIYPKEIELVLDAQPGVAESAVIGVPHPDLGETVLAVVVPEPGAAPSEEALLTRLGAALARFKVPRRIETVAELPRNTMGKVQKNDLRERFADAFAPRQTAGNA